MHLVLAGLLLLGAVFDLLMGSSFLVNPGLAGVEFGLVPDGAKGLSAMRGDFTAFFLVTAIFMAWGAWKRRSDVLLPAFLLYAIAFTGRIVNLIAVGPYDGWIIPLLIEGTHIVVLALGLKAWPIRPVR